MTISSFFLVLFLIVSISISITEVEAKKSDGNYNTKTNYANVCGELLTDQPCSTEEKLASYLKYKFDIFDPISAHSQSTFMIGGVAAQAFDFNYNMDYSKSTVSDPSNLFTNLAHKNNVEYGKIITLSEFAEIQNNPSSFNFNSFAMFPKINVIKETNNPEKTFPEYEVITTHNGDPNSSYYQKSIIRDSGFKDKITPTCPAYYSVLAENRKIK